MIAHRQRPFDEELEYLETHEKMPRFCVAQSLIHLVELPMFKRSVP